MQTRRDGARNERRTGRGDSRALKEQGADPDPFPAGLKGAGPLRRLAVAHPSLRAFAPLGPRSVWLRRPRIGVLPAVRLGVVLSSSRPLSFSPPVRLLSVFAPLSWLASLARSLVRSSPSVLLRRPVRRPVRLRPASCPSSAPHPRPSTASCPWRPVPSSAPRPVRDRHVILSSAIVPLRVHPSTASCPLRVPVPRLRRARSRSLRSRSQVARPGKLSAASALIVTTRSASRRRRVGPKDRRRTTALVPPCGARAVRPTDRRPRGGGPSRGQRPDRPAIRRGLATTPRPCRAADPDAPPGASGYDGPHSSPAKPCHPRLSRDGSREADQVEGRSALRNGRPLMVAAGDGSPA